MNRTLFRGLVALAAALGLGSCDSGPVGPSGGVADVQVSPVDSRLEIGATQQLNAVVVGAGGDTIRGKRVVWASQRPEIAEVSSTGVVRALTPGTTQVAASAGGENGLVTVTVVPRPIAGGEKVGGAVGTGVPGQPLPDSLAVRVVNTAGEPVAGVEVTWSVSSGSISPPTSVTNADGVAKAQWTLGTQPGEQTATAQAAGVTVGIFTVTARAAAPPPPAQPAPVDRVEVSPSSGTISVNGTVDLDATARDAAGNALTGRGLSWRSENTAVATVDGQGRVTGKTPGTATIIATVEGKSGTARITVAVPAPPTVRSVTVEPGSATLTSLGATRRFTATVRDDNRNVIPNVFVSWSSSRDNVAEINSDGLATALGNGTTTITAKVGGVSGTATLVVDQRVDRVVVSPSSATLVEGNNQDFDADAFDANDRRVGGAEIRWSSSNGSVAEVNSTGGVTAKQPGNATITATADGASGSASVTVNARPPATVARVDVSPSSQEIDVGGTADFDATPRDADGNALNRPVDWRSSDQSVATVDDNGRITGIAPGEATITATSEGQSGTATVIVKTAQLLLTRVSAANREGDKDEKFTLKVRVQANGAPVPGVQVDWSASDGGSVSPTRTFTDSNGEAETVWALGGAKKQTASASIPDGQRVEFYAERDDD